MKKFIKILILILMFTFFVGCSELSNFNNKIVDGDGNLQEIELTDLDGSISYLLDIKNFNTDRIQTDIKFVDGEESKVIIKTDKNILDEIDGTVNENSIKISAEKNTRYHATFIEINLVNLKINQFDVDGNLKFSGQGNKATGVLDIKSRGVVSGTFDLSNFSELKLNSEGVFNLDFENLNTTLVDIYSKGTGNLFLSGSTNQLDIEADGVITAETKDLISNITNLNVEGVVVINVHVLNTFNVEAKGVCTIKYLGDPQISKNIEGVSKLEKLTDQQ